MDSLKIANFLFDRIQETINYKRYIDEVNIAYEHAESFGNDYIRMSYTIVLNKVFERLPNNKKYNLFQKTPNYIFTLSTNKNSEKYSQKNKMLRLIEFKHIYESLASYAVLQLEKYLNPDIPIKVKGIDFWPEANYAEKYLIVDSDDRHRRIIHLDFEWDVLQLNSLLRLANKLKRIYTKEKELFSITDIEISIKFGIELNLIRSILLRNEVPVKIKGTKTIDEIHIHTANLANALEKEINNENKSPAYRRLINYLYDNYLVSKKVEISNYQQSEFLKDFIIQKGDILQLSNKRVVMADSLFFDKANIINVKYVILKTNLQASERTRIIRTEDILYILKKQHFLEYINTTPVKHLSLLNRWVTNKGKRLNFTPFELDLTKKI